MKTKLLLFLMGAAVARAINFVGDQTLTAPWATNDTMNFVGNLTLSVPGNYSAAAWNIVGNIQLSTPGDYTLIATGGSVSLAGRIVGQAGSRTTLHVNYRGSLNLVGIVPGNVTLVDDSKSPAKPGDPVIAPPCQWQRNGRDLPGVTGATLSLANVQPADTGLYALIVNGAGQKTGDTVIVGVVTADKVIGEGEEIGADIVAVNGHTYDQVLLRGAAATITADPGQITRLSYIDLSNDIVQVEFSGAGTLSLLLDNPSGPAAPANYVQPDVSYMKGHAGIVIVGADETTNVSVYSVGRLTAGNQSLFRGDVTYDGVADLAFIAISSATGKFGGVRTANASYFATKGLTGLYAPNVQFTGPVFVGDISASDVAVPVLLLGSAAEVKIAGGDLAQANHQPVQVNGIAQLTFSAGVTSQSVFLSAQANKAQLPSSPTP